MIRSFDRARRLLGLVLASALTLLVGVSIEALPAHAAACVPTYGTASGKTTVTFPAGSSGCTWSVPANVTGNLEILVAGGGGAGGYNRGGGGGGGAVIYVSSVAVTGGTTMTITVGAGGTGYRLPAYNDCGGTFDGGNGNSSSLTWSGVSITAAGGTGGNAARSGNASDNTGGTGGVAATPSGVTATTVANGQTGGRGTQFAGGSSFNAAVGGTNGTSISGTFAGVYGSSAGGGYWNGVPNLGPAGGTNAGQGQGQNDSATSGTASFGGGGGGSGACLRQNGDGGSGRVAIAYSTTPYVVTFDANGGSGSMLDQSSSVAANLTANAFTRVGYSFSGWATSQLGSVAYANQASFPFTSNQTLYAVWSVASNSITYDANGGTGAESATTGNTGTSVNLSSGTNLNGGTSSFLGWATSSSATTATYTAGQQITMPGGGLLLYAVWNPPIAPPAPAPVIWTLNYQGNGGTCSTGSTQATDGTWIATPGSSDCTRTGYTFTGWNTRPDGSGLGFAPGGQTQMTGDNTVYAQWQASATPSASPSATPSASPSSSATASPSPSPSSSASASPSGSPSGNPTSSPTSAPTAAPSASPSSSGGSSAVVVPPQEGSVTPGSSFGSVDPLNGATPSNGATLDTGSVAIWDGSNWVQQYEEPGVGSWAVVNGKVVFVPLPGFSGTANSKVRVTDSSGKSGTAPVSFTVPAAPAPTPSQQKGSGGSGAIPPAPVDPGMSVQPKSGTLDSGSVTIDPLSGVIPSNGATVDPSSLKIWDGTEWVTSYADPGVGTWSVVNGKVVFVPVPGFCGVASTTYKVTDSAGVSGTAPISANVPCSSNQQQGSNGSGVIPAPAPPALPASQLLDGSAITGTAGIEGGTANVNDWVTPSKGAQLDASSLVIWNGTSWVKSFTDPGVGTWRVIGSRIVFTPVSGFTGVARTTYRISDSAGRVGQGPISFTVVGGCSSKVFSNRVVSFTSLSAQVTSPAANSVRAFTRGGCAYLVTGYVQPVGTTGNDASLSKERAKAVASVMLAKNTQTTIRMAAGQRLIQPACATSENRCVIIRVMPNNQGQ